MQTCSYGNTNKDFDICSFLTLVLIWGEQDWDTFLVILYHLHQLCVSVSNI